ncbi:MAG: ribonuclease HI family protein [bacterium]
MLKNPLYIIYIDGASSGNPGPAGIGVVIYEGTKKIDFISKSIGRATNNIAEYKSLIAGLFYAKKNGFKNIRVYSDSELIIKQIQGEYLVRNMDLKKLHKEAKELVKEFTGFEILHIKSRENKEANKLAQGGIER